jgi:circadian clock protein KaiB
MSASAEERRDWNRNRGPEKPARYDLQLFVAGSEPNSAIAKSALERICSEHLDGRCRVEIVDVLKDVKPALEENILVTPALIVRQGQVRTVIFGNLTNIDRVLDALDVGSEPS